MTYDDTDKQISRERSYWACTVYGTSCKGWHKNNVFKLVDPARPYKESAVELGQHTSERVNTTKLKNRLLAHIENLKEHKDRKFPHLTFD